tara:strand:- start:9955 stop:10488 length:534 start_codon:yes stop_codon:yes gene_type:complete
LRTSLTFKHDVLATLTAIAPLNFTPYACTQISNRNISVKETAMSDPVSGTNDMIANMTPVLQEGEYVFCTTDDEARYSACADKAIAVFAEPEGASLILPAGIAALMGFDASAPMRCISLMVNSSLEGIGLTAAVAGALTENAIACNVVAAFHHDHIFIPEKDAETALKVLEALQASA